ncbi:MAG: septal ring lytic transglycosylase RlpA family protein [Pseudomonadota bacterium]
MQPRRLKLSSTLKPAAFGLALTLAGCGTTPPVEEKDGLSHTLPADMAGIPDAVPKQEPLSRYGNPVSYNVFGREYRTLDNNKGYKERGIASWYGSKFHGRRTSSGEPYDMFAMTAAHKVLPLPTYARVSNLRNGRSVVVKINDRGPFHDNRLIDLSYSAAWKLGIASEGTGLVEVEAIDSSLPEAKSDPPLIQVEGELPGLFLQVGAFGDELNAHRLRTRLETELETAVLIRQHSATSSPLYRVQVGPIASVELCDQLADRLTGLGIPETRLVIRESSLPQNLRRSCPGCD